MDMTNHTTVRCTFLKDVKRTAPDETCRILAQDLWDQTAEALDDEIDDNPLVDPKLYERTPNAD